MIEFVAKTIKNSIQDTFYPTYEGQLQQQTELRAARNSLYRSTKPIKKDTTKQQNAPRDDPDDISDVSSSSPPDVKKRSSKPKGKQKATASPTPQVPKLKVVAKRVASPIPVPTTRILLCLRNVKYRLGMSTDCPNPACIRVHPTVKKPAKKTDVINAIEAILAGKPQEIRACNVALKTEIAAKNPFILP
jgi:hypothetical protein